MSPAFLMDHIYANDRLALIFYDEVNNRFVFWQRHERRHYSFSYVRNDNGDGEAFLSEHLQSDDFIPKYRGEIDTTLYHPSWKQPVPFKQIFFENPNDVKEFMGGDQFFENHIKYYTRFAIDEKLNFGMPYIFTEDGENLKPVPFKPTKHQKKLAKDLTTLGFEKDMVREILRLLLAPVPTLSYITCDIEVLPRGNVVPNPVKAAEPILSLAFRFSPLKTGIVLSLNTKTRATLGHKINPQVIKDVRSGKYTIEWFEDEREMLKRANEILLDPEYRLFVTFNGDNFDLVYWKYRCQQLNLWVPLRHRTYVTKGGRVVHEIHIEPKTDERQPNMHLWKIHFDLYKFLSQAYIKDYAFRGKYSDNTLETISQALLGYGKIPYEGPLAELSVHDLIHYNFRDVEILDDLMKMQNGIIIALIFLLMRLGYEPFGECYRKAISSKVGNLIQKWVTARGWISPRRMDLRAVDDAEYDRLDKLGVETSLGQTRYKGATVLDPRPGYYFDVECRDFTGLYTNIIHKRNLSFETLCCGHQECFNAYDRDNSTNVIPEIQHYTCIKEKGLMSEIIGLVTTARRLHFKPQAETIDYYEPIEQVLKVFGNAAYGVFGAGFFPYYLRILAESITACSRNALGRVITKAEELGMIVVYGDTDSIFLINVDPNKMQVLVDWTMQELELELNLDYDLQFFTISERKKNYLGIKRDRTPVVKGFKIKKRNTPPLVARTGNTVIGYLSTVCDETGLRTARGKIIFALRQIYNQIWKKEGEIIDYAFNMQVKKRLQSYKALSIHVRAAIMEAEAIIADLPEGISATPDDIIQPGTLQSYIKCAKTVARTPSGKHYRVGVLPLSLAEKDAIDADKYHKELISAMSQIIDMLGITPEDYITRDPMKPALDQFLVKA